MSRDSNPQAGGSHDDQGLQHIAQIMAVVLDKYAHAADPPAKGQLPATPDRLPEELQSSHDIPQRPAAPLPLATPLPAETFDATWLPGRESFVP